MGYRRYWNHKVVPTPQSSESPNSEEPSSSRQEPKDERTNGNERTNETVSNQRSSPQINLGVVTEVDESGSEDAGNNNTASNSIRRPNRSTSSSSDDSEPNSPGSSNKSNVLTRQPSLKTSLRNSMEPISEETESSPESCTSRSAPRRMIKREFNAVPSTSGTQKYKEQPCMYYESNDNSSNKHKSKSKPPVSYPTRKFQSTRSRRNKTPPAEKFDLHKQLEAAAKSMTKVNKAQINAPNPRHSRQPPRCERPPNIPESAPINSGASTSGGARNSSPPPSYHSSSSGPYEEMNIDDETPEHRRHMLGVICRDYFGYTLIFFALVGFLVGVYFVWQALASLKIK